MKQSDPVGSQSRQDDSPLPRKKVVYPGKIEIRAGDEVLGVYSRHTNIDAVKFILHNAKNEETADKRDTERIAITDKRDEASDEKPSASSPRSIEQRRTQKKEVDIHFQNLPKVKESELGPRNDSLEGTQRTSREEEEGVEIRRSDVDTYLIIEDLNTRGIALRKAGKFEEALSCFDRILEIDPEHLAAWNNRGIVLRKLGRREEAEKCFDTVLLRAPANVRVWLHKGAVLFELGRYEEALQTLDQVLALEPNLAEAWRHRAAVLQKLGRISESTDCLERGQVLERER